MALYLHADESIIYPEESGQRYLDEFGVEWVAKVGDVMVPHWALMPGQQYEYIAKNKSDWHIDTQKELLELIPGSSEEVRFVTDDTIRIADIYSPEKKLVVEVQKSPMDAKEMKARVDFHKAESRNVIWIFHKDRLGRLCDDSIYLPQYEGPPSWREYGWVKSAKGVREGRYSEEERKAFWRELYRDYHEYDVEVSSGRAYVRETRPPINYKFKTRNPNQPFNTNQNPPLLELAEPSFLDTIQGRVILIRAVRFPAFVHEDLQNVIVELYPHVFVKVVAVWDLNENDPEQESRFNYIRDVYEMPRVRNFRRILGIKVYSSLEEALKTCSYYNC